METQNERLLHHLSNAGPIDPLVSKMLSKSTGENNVRKLEESGLGIVVKLSSNQ